MNEHIKKTYCDEDDDDVDEKEDRVAISKAYGEATNDLMDVAGTDCYDIAPEPSHNERSSLEIGTSEESYIEDDQDKRGNCLKYSCQDSKYELACIFCIASKEFGVNAKVSKQHLNKVTSLRCW